MITRYTPYHRGLFGFAARAGANSLFWMTTVISLLALRVDDGWIAYSAGAMALFNILFDLPSGALTDRIGTKRIILVAGIVDVIALSLFVFVPLHSSLVLFAYILKGIGFAFESGAYRLMLLELAQDQYGSASATAKSARHIQYTLRIGTLIGLGIGGYLTSLDPRFPWLLATLLMGINVISVSSLRITAPAKRLRGARGIQVSEWITPHSPTRLVLFALAPILLLQLADGFREGTDNLAFAPYFAHILGGSEKLWILPLFMIPIRILGTSLTKRIPDDFAPNGTLISFLAIGLALLIMARFPTPVGGLLGLMIAAFSFSMNQVWLDIWTLRSVPPDSLHKATALSGMSTLKSIITILGSACVGWFALLAPPYTSIYLASGAVILAGVFGAWVVKRRIRCMSRSSRVEVSAVSP